MADTSPLLLLTRPTEDSADFLRAFEAAIGRTVVSHIAPIMGIEPLAGASVALSQGSILVTSKNAVTYGPSLRGRACHVVGHQTAKAVLAAGGTVVSEAPTSKELAESLRSHVQGDRLIWLRGAHVAYELGSDLRAFGIEVEEVPVYRQTALPLDSGTRQELGSASDIVAPVFSPLSAAFLCKAWPASAPAPHVVAISAPTDRAWSIAVASRTIAATPDRGGMIDALQKFFPPERVVAPQSGE